MSANEERNVVETIPVLQIRPNLLLSYNLNIHNNYRRKLSNLLNRTTTETGQETQLSNLKGKKTYSGDMTQHSIKRLRKCINTLVAISEEKEATNFKLNKKFKFKLNFITLTLPSDQGNISDKEIKKQVLDVWIKMAKRRFKLTSYIWKAEKQKNGNLHFHLTTNTYIPFDQLRDTWNARLERLGFISAFEKKHGHRHPNSTDVHATYKIKNLANYLVKYMSKSNSTDLKVNGKMWDCSENLKQKQRCEVVIDYQTHRWLDGLKSKYESQYKINDQCTMLWLTEKQFNQEIIGRFKCEYDNWINSIRYYQPKEKKKVDSVPKPITKIKRPRSLQLQLSLKVKYVTERSGAS